MPSAPVSIYICIYRNFLFPIHEVTLDLKKSFQPKVGFCVGALCTVAGCATPPWHLETIVYLLSCPSFYPPFLTISGFLQQRFSIVSKELCFIPNFTFKYSFFLPSHSVLILVWITIGKQKCRVLQRLFSPSIWSFSLMCSIYSSGTADSCLSFTLKFG